MIRAASHQRCAVEAGSRGILMATGLAIADELIEVY